jgi:hypothetical protein
MRSKKQQRMTHLAHLQQAAELIRAERAVRIVAAGRL